MDHNEPHWRLNSSFSPSMPRRWGCRFHPDGSTRVTNGGLVYGSSVSSESRGNGNGVISEQYPNHQHSVSDGALSYYGSTSDNRLAPRWTPLVQIYDLGEFSTPAGGARPEAAVFSQSNEQRFTSRAPSMSSSLSSPSPISGPTQWASTSKPVLFPPCNFSGRRSFMSKPVYPLVYHNPATDVEIDGIAGPSTFSPDLNFQKTLTQLHKQLPASPDPNTGSSRREGFRWSNASSYEFAFDGEIINITDHISLETPKSPCDSISAWQQRCALCERPLWQKSPWSAHRMVRSSDMPVAGILPCCHVFHAECLEETTPKSQVHEPPCPVCNKAISSKGSISFSEPLQVALKSARRIWGESAAVDGAGSSSSIMHHDWSEGHARRSIPSRGGSLLKSHFRKRFSFKGKTGKDLGAKMFGRSASHQDGNRDRSGRLRFQA